MEIEYLNSLKENLKPRSVKSKSRGLSVERIVELENEINNGNNFPKAYREFLYLAGDYNPIGLDYAFEGLKNGEDIPAIKRVAEIEMNKNRLSIKRPYVILHYYNDDDFIFIYLDEGDNPQPYAMVLNPLKGMDHTFPIKGDDSLSSFVDGLVDRALKGLQPF